MGLLRFLNKRSGGSNNVDIPMAIPSEPQEEVLKSENVENMSDNRQDADIKKPLTVSYATGWPIDVVYGYLHKSYEEKGFSDAMVKGDLAFRDLNMSLIRNKILMVFREVNLNYDIMGQDLQVRINNCNAAGLLTTVSEIEKRMAIINAHKEELRQLEMDFRNNANEASIPLQSYNCGFLRGIATVAMSAPKDSPAQQVPNYGGMMSKSAIA